MKILVVPDIHGSWANIIPYIKANKDLVDKIVTLGDYVDDWDDRLNGLVMINGFKQLIEMARAEPNKFVILIGNHDHSYISSQSCSGHRPQYAAEYHRMFMDNMDVIHVAALIDRCLFSHAGISQLWYNRMIMRYNEKHEKDFVPKELMAEYNKWAYNDSHIEDVYFGGRVFSLVKAETPEEQKDIDEYRKIQDFLREKINNCADKMRVYYRDTIKTAVFNAETLDKIFHEDPEYFCHCGWNSAGDSSGESCLWIRPSSLLRDNWPGHLKCQVVGHTEMGLKRLQYRTHKLIVCDSRKHDCAFVLDTDNIGEFEKAKFTKNKNYDKALYSVLLHTLIAADED